MGPCVSIAAEAGLCMSFRSCVLCGPFQAAGAGLRVRLSITLRWWLSKPSPETYGLNSYNSFGIWYWANPFMFNYCACWPLKWTEFLHACRSNKIDDITHMHTNLKLKNLITIKLSTQIKFQLYHYFSYDKIFKIISHLPMFAWHFFKTFFIILNT